jgi:transcriptional regulator with XRE-family HTH domain
VSTEEQPAFGTLLGRFRAAAGLTQEELAERAGLSVEAIGTLERGTRTRPRRATIRLLAEALQLSPDDRSAFEQAARAEDGALPAADDIPKGDFLGALPAGELVGREQEQERLRSILDAVADGRGTVLLLGGEAGVGKTRLLQELMVEVRARGFIVLSGLGAPSEQDTPYALILDALGTLADRTPQGIRGEVQRRWRRVQSFIEGAAAAEEESRNQQLAQQQIFTAVSDLLLLLAQSTPVAVLLDDLQ